MLHVKIKIVIVFICIILTFVNLMSCIFDNYFCLTHKSFAQKVHLNLFPGSIS